MGEIVDGEIIEPSKEVAEINTDHAVQEFNPLDAQPVAFQRSLAERQENYDSLQLHLQGVLVHGKDFARLHVANKQKCPEPWNCSYEKARGHWSDYQLLAAGADKILGILGLGVHYPDMKDYKRAVLQGHNIQEVISDCQILGHSGQVIAEGAGACAREEVNGSLNRCIKQANKRARLDAVKRLPVVNALFEDGFLEAMAEAQKVKAQRTAAQRAQQIRNIWDTGARLEVCPIGNTTKGKPWHEIETYQLEWMVKNCLDKPDIIRAAEGELSKRTSATGSSSIRTPSSPDLSEEDPNE